MSTPKVFVVILAWNQLEETIGCLDSLRTLNTAPYCTILVDNGSTDDTFATVSRDYPDVVIVKSEQNLGVAGGYNLGMRYAIDQGADYVLITNNDVEYDPKFLDELLDLAQTKTDVGIVQPKIYYHEDRDRLWIIGARWRAFPPAIKTIGTNQLDGPPFDKVQELEYAPSCAFLIAAEVIQDVGVFDETYFFYYDDWDYCARVRAAGYRVYFAPEARMWHKVSVSTLKSDKPGRWWYIRGQSSVRYFTTHRNLQTLFWVNVWFVIRETVTGKANRVLPYIVGVISGHAQRLGWTTSQITNPTVAVFNEQEKAVS